MEVNFNDLLLLCFCTDLLSTTVSSFFEQFGSQDDAFSCVFVSLGPSYEDDLIIEIFLKKLCLVGAPSLEIPSTPSLETPGTNDKVSTLSSFSSVCVEMSIVVMGMTGGESDEDNLDFLLL